MLDDLDLDLDGDLDVMTSTWDPKRQLRMFRNDGDRRFVETTAEAGLTGLFGGLNLIQTDYDNDGDIDVMVLRGAWLSEEGRIPNSLLRNDGQGRFTDVTFDAGLGETYYPTQTAARADYDNDGDLDVFIGNESHTKIDYDGNPSTSSGIDAPCELYRNNGDGTFDDVAAQLGVTGPQASFPAWFWDFDNDSALDLFVASYTGRVQNVGAYYAGVETVYEKPGLYRGDGRGGFRQVALEQGLDYPILPMGANFGDIDGDGYLDFYLGTGDPSYRTLMPNVMYLNLGGTGFADVTMAGGFGHLQKGHGVAFGDIDDDGDLDVFEQMGGAFPGDGFANAVFENPGFGRHWITVKLVGTMSNRAAIGARIHLRVEERGQERSIYRHVGSGGSFGASPLRQTIGIGDATRIERLELYWPTTDRTQVLHDVGIDGYVEIVEE